MKKKLTRALTKVERLALAGRVAPLLRGKRPRQLKTVNPRGDVVRTVSDVQLAESLLARQKIELELTDHARRFHCRLCGKKLSTNRGRTGRCVSCMRIKDLDQLCPGYGGAPCNAIISRTSFTPSAVLRREGKPARCRSCASKAASLTKDETARRAKSARMLEAMSPEQKQRRLANLRTAIAAIPKSVRSENSRRANAELSAEARRQKIEKLRRLGRTSERRDALKSMMAQRTPEQRSQAARKTWATRRAQRRAG